MSNTTDKGSISHSGITENGKFRELKNNKISKNCFCIILSNSKIN